MIGHKVKVRKSKGIKGWIKDCDELFALIVKRRAGWKCFETGRKDNLQCAHIISRNYKGTRWDFDNAVCLTGGRHKWYHNNPIQWKRYINQRFGEGYYEKMEEKALPVCQMVIEDYRVLYEKLNSEWTSGS